MGELQKKVASTTEKVEDAYINSKYAKGLANVSANLTDAFNVATNTVVLALSKAWIGLGMVRPAKTEKSELFSKDALSLQDTGAYKDAKTKLLQGRQVASRAPLDINRSENYDKLWFMRFDSENGSEENNYYMPLSQTFNLKAKKKLNISSLVDGIDIIQQTRKEAKTIECTLRIGLNPRQKNLQILDVDNNIVTLSDLLSDLYESDKVFYISNDVINNTFGVEYVMITDYRFTPRVGMGTYTFEFSLIEVKYGENVLTLDLKEVDAQNNGQIT